MITKEISYTVTTQEGTIEKKPVRLNISENKIDFVFLNNDYKLSVEDFLRLSEIIKDLNDADGGKQIRKDIIFIL